MMNTSSSDMTNTGTWAVPGTGTRDYRTAGAESTSTEFSTAAGGSGMASDGRLRLAEEEPVAEAAPVLLACGQGRSMYDVKGCLSSWVLVRDGVEGTAGKDGMILGEKDHRGGSGGGMVMTSPKGVDVHKADLEQQGSGINSAGAAALGTWALRSELTAAGDGGVVCSTSLSLSQGSLVIGERAPRVLLTGGKDCILREWRVTNGRPRCVAVIRG